MADPDNSVCNDGLFCTVTDTCQSGTCTGSGNPCPGPDGDDNCAESCNEGASDCTAADPDGVACNDNLFCNGTDSCQAGACSQHGGNPCPGPDGDNDCGESCNEGASDCTAADPDGAACNDGVFCNGSDSCQAGACFQHGGDPCPGPDGDANCAESCNEGAGDCTAADTDGSACADDGLFCTGPEQCQGGSCNSLGNPCTPPGSCDDINDLCAGCGDGVVSAGEQCDPVAPASDNCCDPGSCQWTASGMPDPQLACSVAPECQLDVCDGSGGCTTINDANGIPCTDDGFFCTGSELCQNGSCTGSGNPCPGPDGDNNCAESCNEGAGDCTAADPDSAACDDSVFCNGTDSCLAGACSQHGVNPCPGPDGDNNCAESCNEGAGDCTAADPDSAACDDSIFCNGADSCLTGACSQHGGNPCPGPDGDSNCAESCNEGAGDCTLNDPDSSVCDDSLFCNGADSCLTGACSQHGGNPCPGPDGDSDCAESCNEGASDCTAADPDSSVCNDGLFCTVTDTCQSGLCTGSGNPCPGPDGDGNCAESCNEGAGDCTLADPDSSVCDDSLFCNGADSCLAGACSQHGGNPCPGPDGDNNCAESCNEGAGDCTLNDPDASICDDSIFCNGADSCQVGACSQHGGNPCPGPDGDNDCAESCDELADNCLADDPNGSACDDLLYCTLTDTCTAGACGGTGNPCPGPDGDNDCAESCDELADNCLADDPNGSACDDLLYCTLTDTCTAGACGGTGNPCPGPDGDNDCAESCDELADNCLADDPNGSACDDGIDCTSPAPGNDTCDGLGVCSGIPDNLYCDTFVALGDLCYPSCSPDTSGCVTPPGSLALTCENPVYLDVDTVSDCSITLAGGGDIIGQEACLSCSASVGVTTLINTDFEDDLNPGSCAPVVDQVADGWTIVSGTSCYGTGTSCPMSNPNNRDCCDNLKCPIDLAGTIAFQADRDTCTSGSRQWRLQHTFDATGLQNIELCFDYAGNGATGDEILQIDLADASNYQPNVFCDDGGPTGGVNNIWFRTCVDLSAAAVFADNNPALRVIFFLHSNNGNDRIYIDNITLRGESISCPATTTTLTEDFSGCSDPLTDWNGWTVGGGATINCSPRFNCYDLSNRAWVNNTGGGVGEFYQYFDMSAVTDVELCFYYGENGANGGEIVTVDVDSGLGWQTQWSNEGNFGANNTCAQVCLNLSDLDPAVDHNANAGIRIQLEAGDHEIDLDQIVFSGHQDCTVPAVVSLGNPQDPDNDGIYDFTATDTDGQLTSDITCQWDPDAMLSDWSRVWYRPLNLKPSNIQPERMCANSYDLDIGADATIDTDLGTITGVAGGDIVFAPVSQGGGFPNIGVFSFNSINIQSGVTVTVQGNNALALLSCTGVDIQGTLDASGTDGLMSTDGSCFSGLGGPGGYDGGQCFGSGPPNDGQGPGGGGAGGDDSPCNSGGAGGGFGGIGGAGGDGNDGGGCFVAGPLPAVPYGLPELVPLIGGSGGGCGGDDYGGPGGGGGGAVQLSAGGTLSVPAGGLILTAGGGGEGGHDGGDSGAGGGSGSGGAILLEAEFITIAGKLAANGGGGGAGFDGNPGWGTGVAASGQPGTPDESSALGGASTGMGGGDGGDGSGGIVPVGDTGLAAENGGGGGGGTGRIRINTGGGAADIQAGAIISPTGNLGQCTGICTQGVVEGW